jgi:hypothetical protein
VAQNDLPVCNLIADVMVSHINVFVPRMILEWVSSQHDCLQIIFPNHGRLVLRAFQIREQLAKPTCVARSRDFEKKTLDIKI